MRPEDNPEEMFEVLANRYNRTNVSAQQPITALAPFVPKVLLSSIREDGDSRYSALDGVDGLHGLAAASRNMQPSMVHRQAAIMVADVKGFTQLTELLSKRGK